MDVEAGGGRFDEKQGFGFGGWSIVHSWGGSLLRKVATSLTSLNPTGWPSAWCQAGLRGSRGTALASFLFSVTSVASGRHMPRKTMSWLS